MAVPCAWARGMNLYGIAAIPWFPSEVLKLATSDVQQPLEKSPTDTSTIARNPADNLLTSTPKPCATMLGIFGRHSRTLSGDRRLE